RHVPSLLTPPSPGGRGGADTPAPLVRGRAASPGGGAAPAVVLDAPAAAEGDVPPAQRPATSLLATGALEAAAEQLEELARRLAADGLGANPATVATGPLMGRRPALATGHEHTAIQAQRRADGA